MQASVLLIVAAGALAHTLTDSNRAELRIMKLILKVRYDSMTYSSPEAGHS